MAFIKTLVLSGGIIHDGKGCGDEIEQILRQDKRFKVTRAHDDLSVLDGDRLSPYDVVVLYYTRGELTGAQRDGLTSFVAAGKGFVGVHSASASFRECPEFHAMLGGIFTTHPKPRMYQVSVVDPEHPITEGIVEFFVDDEQYIMDYDPRVTVLASALFKGKAEPVIWTKNWGQGRVYYLALGHTPECCRHEQFAPLLVHGTAWASGNG